MPSMASADGHVNQTAQGIGMGAVTACEIVHAPGRHLPWHSHHAAALVLTIKGCATEVFENVQFDRAERSVLVRPAGTRHCDFIGPRGARFFRLEFTPTSSDDTRRLRSALPQPSIYRGGAITCLAQQAYREWLYDDQASRIALHAIALEILAHLTRERDRKIRELAPLWLRLVKQRLDRDFANALRLTELAGIAGVHVTQLARRFRSQYGKSIGEYLRQQRVDAAAQLLAGSELSLTEIAFATGFAHHAHFSTVFKRLMKQTPSEYRRLHLTPDPDRMSRIDQWRGRVVSLPKEGFIA